MTSSHIANGSIKVSNDIIPITKALEEIDLIKQWLDIENFTNSKQKILSTEGESNQFVNLNLKINKKTDELIQWKISQNEIEINIDFEIKKYTIRVYLLCPQFSIHTLLQEWIYRFYRLKELIEKGTVDIPTIEFSHEITKDLIVSIPIQASKTAVFKSLTEKHYLSQIFSNYPESVLEDFRYSWGWIVEGPSNLISFKPDSILIHDFLVDFNPIGYVKWELENDPNNHVLLTLTHKDIALMDEIDPLKAFNSYKYGWMYYLAKIKDLTEHKSFTIHFIDEIVD